jgi:hypothetical protein
VGGQRHTPAALLQERNPVPIAQEAGWAPAPVWKGEENFAATVIRFPERPACSESLYRLRNPGPSIYRVEDCKSGAVPVNPLPIYE